MSRRLAARRGAFLPVALAAVAAVPAAAHAATSAPATCAADATLSTPFAPWGDPNEYRLLPGGDFAAGAPGWTLSGGAEITSDGDPFELTGTPSASSVALPAGASVVSPFTCVDATQPTFRFMVNAASANATVQVSVVYATPRATLTVPVGWLTGTTGWRPSPILEDGAAIAGLLQGGTAQMAIRLDGVSGSTEVDDVFVDPQHSWG